MASIFIQIPCYRDAELIPTVYDALQQAEYPQNLYFGIAVQSDNDFDWSELYKLQTGILTFSVIQSQGAGWARAQLQSLYTGQDYTLSIDSHYRFDKGWDSILMKQLDDALSFSKKPVITRYPNSYKPPRQLERYGSEVLCARYQTNGVLKLVGKSPANNNLYNPGFFIAAGCYFTFGSFLCEAPSHPLWYFETEEPLLSLQAYIKGWDVIHPNSIPLYHYYYDASKPRPVHWENYSQSQISLEQKARALYWKEYNSPVDNMCNQTRSKAAFWQAIKKFLV